MSTIPIRTWKQHLLAGLPAGLMIYLACLSVGGLIFYLAEKALSATRTVEALSRSELQERRRRVAAEAEATANAELAAKERERRLAAEKEARAQAQTAEQERQARIAAEKRAQQEAAERKTLEAEGQKRRKDLNDERVMRLTAEQEADEAKEAVTDTWQVARLVNRTRITIYFQIREASGNWHEEELSPGYGRTYWQRGEKLEVKFDSSTAPGNQSQTYDLDTKTVTDGPPTEADKARAPETAFEIAGNDRNGYLLIDMYYNH